MNEIIPFEFDSKQVRVIKDETGAPWFVAKDVCEVLGIANHRDATSRLDDDERDDVGLTDAIGRKQNTTVVNEPGLYNLVLRSDKPEAKAFKRWITHEVLPSIRKTGAYTVNKDLPPSFVPLARELGAAFNTCKRAGLDDHTARLKANEFVKAKTGWDCIKLCGAEHLYPELTGPSYTTAELGRRMGLDIPDLNSKLIRNGLAAWDGKMFRPTEKGMPHAMILNAGRRYEDGTPVQYVKWFETVIKAIPSEPASDSEFEYDYDA